jgi:hypothetical protein
MRSWASIIAREHVLPAPPTVENRVGTRVLQGVPLSVVPREVAVEVPEVRTYKYFMVNDRAGPSFFSASNLP